MEEEKASFNAHDNRYHYRFCCHAHVTTLSRILLIIYFVLIAIDSLIHPPLSVPLFFIAFFLYFLLGNQAVVGEERTALLVFIGVNFAFVVYNAFVFPIMMIASSNFRTTFLSEQPEYGSVHIFPAYILFILFDVIKLDVFWNLAEFLRDRASSKCASALKEIVVIPSVSEDSPPPYVEKEALQQI
uniref:Uncharacterized protein n=1 Tax=Pristionchus pacificus TaxID=54126 RepID=A0A8R1UPR0_PRIPA